MELYQGYERMIESECFYFFAQQYIDILIFCIQTHNSRIRYYIIKNEIIQHVLKGLILKKKIISLIIAKFYKAIIQSKDEFLIRYLETRNLLKPLMDHFSKPIHKSEMFKSIILDIIKTIYIENNEILKKQLEDYDIMSTSLFKNVKANAQQLKSKQIFLKDHKLNMLPTNERISDCGVDKKVVKKQGILNLNYLDEEDGDLIVKDFDDLPKNENYEINNKIGDILYEGVISNDEKIIKNNLNEKRVHPTNEDIQYLEQDTTRMKKVKLE